MTDAPTPGAAPRFARLQDWLRWQETLHVREIDLGLERCRAVAERLELLRLPFPLVTVAGTNGKGSSVAMLANALLEAGLRVGTYTSPHLLRYNERIQIDRESVDDDRICAAFARIDAARGDIPLTYFEFGTLAAVDIFLREQPDVVVLEVGLGGRLDAVNCFDADVALLTAIDIDHVEWLGPDRESIGREKAGILRAGRPAVCSDPRPPASLALEATRIGAKLHQLGTDFDYAVGNDGWRWQSADGAELEMPALSLDGEFQYQNAAGVVMALRLLAQRLPGADAAIADGVCGTRLDGRFERASLNGIPVLLDVAHNPHAAAALARNLLRDRPAGRLRAVVGMLRDKDAAGVVEQLRPLVDEWLVVSLGGPRGSDAEVLTGALARLGVRDEIRVCGDVAGALAAAAAASAPGDGVLVFGSFLTVSAAKQALADTVGAGA